MMMKIRLTYTFLLAAALSMLTACSSDDAAQGGGEKETTTLEEGLSEVRIHLSVAAPSGPSMQMRAYSDDAAVTEEMMNLWTVVAVNSTTHKVAFIHAAKPATAEREIDDLVKLENGTYDFYSFANIPPSVVCQLLGIGGYDKGGQVMRDGNDGGNDPTSGNGNEDGGEQGDPITRYDASNDPFMSETGPTVDNNVYNITFTEGEEVTGAENIEVGIDGNGFDITATNVFGATGIPMSNVQTGVIIDGTKDVNLIVVRMMAKIQLQIKNSTGASVTVKSATLSNVTKNKDGNLKLLPTLTQHDTMEPTHGDITPNLGTAVQEDLTIAINKDIADDATENVTFYVNECGTPNNPEGLFYLSLEMDNSGTSEYRYALIDQTGATTADDNKWAYIARNDYRIIPIQLDDLKFEIIPYDFPAIGVYPVSVKEVDATNHVYDFEFHDYGHFHLLPSVTKSGTAVEFSASTPTSGTDYKWTLVGNNFANSWFTASTKGGAWVTTNTGIEALGFYRTGYSVTSPVDGDEVGGIPVWYANTTGSPQWDPAASATYRPFIFGYIADPGSATKKQVYHEMKIQVYNGTVAYRQMLYRFYMTLSADQMLYSRMFGAPRVRHTHGY